MARLLPRDVRFVVLHTTDGSWDATLDDVRATHLARGWSGVGYHFLVWSDGRVEAGRPIHQRGAHVRGLNGSSIGIAMVGPHGEEPPTAAQLEAACELAATLAHTYDLERGGGAGRVQVIGHAEAQVLVDGRATKTCPGPHVDMDQVRAIVAQRRARMMVGAVRSA